MTISTTDLSVMGSGRTILYPTSLSIQPVECVRLVGGSGSGKSTLGHALVDDLRTKGQAVAHVPQSPDEALDPVVAAGTMDLLDSYLSDKSTALLFITHDLGLAARRVSRLIVMQDGRIVEDAAHHNS